MRLLLQAAALCCAIAASTAEAHPFTVDDLLKVDRRGAAGVSPDGRWLVLSVNRGQAYAPRFDYDAMAPYAARRLYRVDLRRPGPATPLLSADPAAGYTAGPFSPDGRRVLVNRLMDHRWETGVVDIATGQVRWLGVGMDFAVFGRAAQWRSDHEIVAIVTPPDAPHFIFRRGWERSDFLKAAREKTGAEGGPSVLAIGSGRFLDRGWPSAQKTLARIDVDTGVITPLASGAFVDLEISSSGRFVAAVKDGADIQPNAGDLVRGGTSMRLRDLVVADLTTNSTLSGCSDCALSPFFLAWAPRDDRLLIFARKPGEAVAQGRLQVVTPEDGRLAVHPLDVRPALNETYEGFELIQAGWVGALPAVLALDGAKAAPAWQVIDKVGARPLLPAALPSPDKIVADGEGRLLVVAGGKAYRIDGGQMTRLDDVALAPGAPLGDGGRLSIRQLSAGDTLVVKRHGRLVRLERAREQDLGPDAADAFLTDRTGVSVTADRDGHGVETLSRHQDRAATPLLTLNPTLSEVEFGPVRPVSHTGPGGETLTSWVVLPADWRADHPPPLVVLPYPGRDRYSATTPPESARPGVGLTNISAQVLAGHGYAVLLPSLPRERYPDDPAEGLADQILTVVDAVGAAGLADTTRVALWGHSFGGHAVLAAATQSDRFKAIVCTSGIGDLVGAWGRDIMQSTPAEGFSFNGVAGYVETGQMRVGGPPWAKPEAYLRNSPLFHADKITAPVLLAYGDLDAYSDGQGGEMFSALYRQGKDAKLLTFWGEGHVIMAPGNVQRLYAEVLDWLDLAFDPAAGQAGQPRRP